jgi:hypothetical protein
MAENLLREQQSGHTAPVSALPDSSARILDSHLHHGRKSIMKTLKASRTFDAPLTSDITWDIILCGKAIGIFVGIAGTIANPTSGEIHFQHHLVLKRREWLAAR